MGWDSTVTPERATRTVRISLTRCANSTRRQSPGEVMPCGAQGCDPMDEASRLRTFKGEPVNVSKSSLRLAWPSRAVATALLLLPAEQPASEQDVPVLVYGVQAGAARAGVGPVAHPGRAGRENRVSDAVCGRARSRALVVHQRPRSSRCEVGFLSLFEDTAFEDTDLAKSGSDFSSKSRRQKRVRKALLLFA